MTIGKQINVRGNGNVVAEHVQIYIGHEAAQRNSRFDVLHTLISITIALALGISLTGGDFHPAIAGSLFLAFLLSIAVLLRGTANDGASKRGADGHIQHDTERPPGQSPGGQ